MRVAISGSRSFDDRLLVDRVVARLVERKATIHVGDAKSGVDSMVLSEVRRLGLTKDKDYKVFIAHWDRHGKRAGHLRNGVMIRNSDELIAIFSPGPMTRGTSDAVSQAQDRSLPMSMYHDGKWYGLE